MNSLADTCVQRGGGCVEGFCKDFIKNFCLVSAIN